MRPPIIRSFWLLGLLGPGQCLAGLCQISSDTGLIICPSSYVAFDINPDMQNPGCGESFTGDLDMKGEAPNPDDLTQGCRDVLAYGVKHKQKAVKVDYLWSCHGQDDHDPWQHTDHPNTKVRFLQDNCQRINETQAGEHHINGVLTMTHPDGYNISQDVRAQVGVIVSQGEIKYKYLYCT